MFKYIINKTKKNIRNISFQNAIISSQIVNLIYVCYSKNLRNLSNLIVR
jgi:hypothetical protein